MKRVILGALLTLAGAGTIAAGSPSEIREGTWEIRTRAVARESGRETPTMIQEKQMGIEGLLPHPERYGKTCRQSYLRRSTARLEWEILCDGNATRSVRADYRLDKERFEGTVIRRGRSLYGRDLTIENRISGRYLGEKTPSQKTPKDR